jgi:cysteinyl-tRNA synthetase
VRKLERLRGALRPAVGDLKEGPAVTELQHFSEHARAHFSASMDDDLNTAGALAALFELVRAINTARDAGVGNEALGTAQAALRELAGVLGLRLAPRETRSLEIAPFIDLLIDVRTGLRKARQFDLADSIRTRLAELGVTLEDGPQGTTWKTE